jgi:Predicted Zn-dependent peptidases
MIKVYTLSNAIRVVCEPIPYLHSVSIGAWVNVGSGNENASNNGISHMIEHMLFKGTKTKTAKDIAKVIASIGGNLNAFTSKDCTSYFACTLDEYLGQTICLLGDIFQNSLLAEEELEKEKGVILEEIDMYEDSPEDMAHEMLHKVVWKDHPLGYIISGSPDNVNCFTRKELETFMNTYYVGENIVISVAGNFKEDSLLEQLEESFGQIPRGSKRGDLPVPIYRKAGYKKRQEIEQIHMDLAFPNTTNLSMERYPFYIINSILGESVTSRLFQKIREEKGLTYTIYSYGSLYKQAGLFQIYAAMNPKQLPIVYEEIIRIMKSFTVDSITDEEIKNTMIELKTELILDSESTQNRMETNAKCLLRESHIITEKETIDNITNVTREDIDCFIQKYLKTDDISYAIVGQIDKSTKLR